MAPRANWKGYLKLSLVSCAVNLYPASSSSSRVSFNTINRKTGNRVKRQFVDAATGEVVETEDQAKGYEIDKNSFLMIEEEDLDAVQIESTHTIDIEKFVPRTEVDPRYLDVPYYIAPNERVAQEAFSIIRQAMVDQGVVGLGRVVIARRERIIMLEPQGKGLLGTVLRYAYEVRGADAYFEDIPELKLPEEMLDLAHVIIKRKEGHFDPEQFGDRYEDAVVAMIRAKQAGQPARTQEPARASNVIDIMEALRKSIAVEGGAPPKAGKPAKAAEPAESAAPSPKPKAPSKTRKPAAAKAPAPEKAPAKVRKAR